MTVYRLEAERAGGGPHLFPRPFATVEDACAYAEVNIDRLAAHFGWRVRGFRVLELPSMRVVTTIRWHDPVYDPDPFGPDQFLPGIPAGNPGDTAGPDNTPAPPPGVEPARRPAGEAGG